MRIMFVHSGVDLYGASRSVLRIAARLSHDGHAVVVVLPADGPLAEALIDRGVTVRIVEDLPFFERSAFRNITAMLRLARKMITSIVSLRTLAKDFRPHLVHTNTSIILTSGVVSLLLRIPHVWHIRDFYMHFPVL